MIKISQILRETKIHQITGDLIRFEWHAGQEEYGDLIGKCAMGILACESPIEEFHLSKQHQVVGDYDKIIESYDIDVAYISPNVCKKNGEIDWDFECDVNISTVIVRLNDTFEFTFKEIADFLEVTFDL